METRTIKAQFEVISLNDEGFFTKYKLKYLNIPSLPKLDYKMNDFYFESSGMYYSIGDTLETQMPLTTEMVIHNMINNL